MSQTTVPLVPVPTNQPPVFYDPYAPPAIPDPYAPPQPQYYVQPQYGAPVKYKAPRDVYTRRTVVGFTAFPILLLLATILTLPLIIYLIQQGGVDALAADGGMEFAEQLISPEYLGINAAITVGSQLLIIVLALLFTGELRNWRDALALKAPVLKRWYVIAAALGVAAFALLQGINYVLEQLGGTMESSDTSTAIANTTGTTRILMLAFLVPIFIPLVEEMFFRGLLFNSLARGNMLRRLSPRVTAIIAAIVSSLCFALAHLQMTGGLATAGMIVGYTGFIALINCWLVYKTGSIIPGWILHLVYNGLTVLAMIALGV